MAAMLALAGCASSNNETNEPSGGNETDAGGGSGEGGSGDGPKIGLAYDVGGRGDQSFNDSAFAGIEEAANQFDATYKEIEANAGENDADREERLRVLADAGYDPIIAVGYVYSPAVDTVGAEYPELSFAVVDGFSEAENAANLDFAANEGSFLVGVAAALTTKSNNVGFIGGVDGPLIQAFEAGYVAGVEAVDPKIEIQIQYLSQDDAVKGYENPAGGKIAATGMYENGADVVYHAAGKSGLGLFDAVVAAGEGNWAIGVDSDQYLTADPDQQPYILTSMLKRIDVSIVEYVKAFVDRKAPTGYVVYDLETGGVDYATSGGFVDDIKDEIDDYKQKILDGEIEVPAEP